MVNYLSRLLLLTMLAAMTYIALLPEFNFEVWVPVELLSALSVPSILVELITKQADKIAHFIGAFAVLLLCGEGNKSSLSTLDNSSRQLGVLLLVTVVVEVAQYQIGRNFSLLDIAAGMLGGLSAVLIRKCSQSMPSRITCRRKISH